MIPTFIQKVSIISENNASEKIGELIHQCGYRKPFVVCDHGIVNLDFVKNILSYLNQANLEYYLYSDVYANPEDELVEKGLQLCIDHHCDCILAIGGGSSIDVAKCINLMRFNDGNILDYETKKANDCYGFFSIPTTAGTGSELSQGAIISDRKTHQKKLIFTDCFQEEYTILDASLTIGLSKIQTAYTGLDVFSHAVESYTATKASPIVDLICEKVMESVVEYLPKAVGDGNNLEAREKMLNAASLGGWVLMCSSDHLGHALAHIIGAKYNMIHGKACMVGWPSMIDFIADQVPTKIMYIAQILNADINNDDSFEVIKNKTITAYLKFCESLEVSREKLSYEEKDLHEMAQELVSNPFLEMCPKTVTLEDAENIIKKALR